jgi:ABC-2 type transport system permease protein
MKHVLSKQNRVLLLELVRTDFKLRYQGSALGYAWSLLRPLMMFAILYIVFVKFIKLGDTIPHFPIYLLLGIVLWTFFADMTSQSLGSIVGRGDLIRKIRIPRWIIVVSSSISALINLFLNLVVVIIFMLFNKVDLLQTTLWLPLIFLEIFIIGLGLSLLLSAAFVKYRDLTYIWEVILQAGFYVTPILYSMTLIKNVDYQKILLLNPLAQAIQDARYAVVTHDSSVVTIDRAFQNDYVRLIPIVMCALFLIIGVLYFKKEAKNFAENL